MENNAFKCVNDVWYFLIINDYLQVLFRYRITHEGMCKRGIGEYNMFNLIID